MNPTKWNLVSIVTFSLISTGIQSLSKENTGKPTDHLQRRHVSISNQLFNAPSYWEHILREFVFKTISPPPPGNNQLYKRLLEAPFYSGPFPIVSNDATDVVLSRGDIYYLPNGHWLFCQQGCSDCEVCIEHTHPTVKWMLRRIKRISSHGSTRHDLQLTIVPQIDGSYHMRSLSPQSYVYVTSQGEQDAYLNDRRSHRNDQSAYVEDGFSEQQRKSEKFWRYVDKDSLPEKRVVGKLSNDTVSKEHVGSDARKNVESTSVTPKKEDSGSQGNETKNVKREPPRVTRTETRNANGSISTDVRLTENGGARAKHLIPKLILGTDQLGQKHLVHVVPADASANTSLMNTVISNVLDSAGRNKTAYQRILRRIFDSLNNNKRSIESFLQPVTTTEKEMEQSEEHRQEETKSGFPGLRRVGRFYPVYDKGTRNESSFQNRWPYTINWSKERTSSNSNPFGDGIINGTVNIGPKSNNSYSLHPKVHNSVIRNNNASERVRSKWVENNNNNDTVGSSFKMNNVTRTDQGYQFLPRKYKILVTTESTTKSSEIMNHSKSVQNHSYLTSTDQNIIPSNKNSMYINIRNSTQ